MALFTNKADAGLSRLTRFYQLEIPECPSNDPELRQDWGQSLMEETASELLQFVEQERMAWEKTNMDGRRVQNFVYTPSDLAELADFQAFLKRLMDTAADNQAPSGDDHNALNQHIQDLLKPKQIMWMDLSHHGYRCYYASAFPVGGAWVGILKRPLLEDFLEALLDDRFVRCEECRSVFPKRKDRKEQRHCSQRCRARVGNRRRYQMLFGPDVGDRLK